jgi:hypothetical protein
MEKPMLAMRDQIAANVRAIRMGAAKISQLLAEELQGGDDWERAVRLLAECRAERKRLDDRLAHIDAIVALMWECDL